MVKWAEMGGDRDFTMASNEQIEGMVLRLSDVGLSDESPVYEKPSVWDRVRRLPRRLKPWKNPLMWGGNLASHLIFCSQVFVERLARHRAT